MIWCVDRCKRRSSIDLTLYSVAYLQVTMTDRANIKHHVKLEQYYGFLAFIYLF